MSYVEYNGHNLPVISSSSNNHIKIYEYLYCNICKEIKKHWRNDDYLMLCESCKNENYLDQSRSHREINKYTYSKFFDTYFYNVIKAILENSQIVVSYRTISKKIHIFSMSEKDFKNKIQKPIIETIKWKNKFNKLPKLYFHSNTLECKGYKHINKIDLEYWRILIKRREYMAFLLKKSGFCYDKIIMNQNGFLIYFDEFISVDLLKFVENIKPEFEKLKSLIIYVNTLQIPFSKCFDKVEYPFEILIFGDRIGKE